MFPGIKWSRSAIARATRKPQQKLSQMTLKLALFELEYTDYQNFTYRWSAYCARFRISREPFLGFSVPATAESFGKGSEGDALLSFELTEDQLNLEHTTLGVDHFEVAGQAFGVAFLRKLFGFLGMAEGELQRGAGFGEAFEIHEGVLHLTEGN